MEAYAIKRYLRMSPRKVRLVVDLIRGKKASEALAILKFCPKAGSIEVERVLRSALSNLQNLKERGTVDPENVIVKRAFVDQSVTLKRILPAPMGRAYRLRKRSCHISISVEEIQPKNIVKPKVKKEEKVGTEN
ncbi:50S ribosomal protein L22 [Bacteroidetes/Chlorobi group bacterium MS-B_bin-24]|jgi:large subunit ribosomal protein L22|nr:MAG: 50S ribosomal protein L22 [Bacteroidetes/Chlorobi group bacterium MS-B_bin-24]